MLILHSEAQYLLDNDAPLMEKEIQYLKLVAEGLEPRDIKATLGINDNELKRLDTDITKHLDI